MALTAVILNDTSGHHHFGCFRVMRIIEQALASRGIAVTARSMVRQDWERSAGFLAALAAADIVVINGEGTLHHGSRHAEKLLRIVRHPARRNIPVVILNALFQDNPPEWDEFLNDVALISVRDARSHAELQSRYSGELHRTLDFSLFEAFSDGDRAGRKSLIIGDSVFQDVTEALATLSDRSAADTFLPIVRTIKSSKPQFTPLRRKLREMVIFLHRNWFRLRHGKTRYCESEYEYLHELSKGRLHVTGRFHSVCFSLLTLTPFLVLSSNSWKIEALIEDLGLSPDRIIKLEDVVPALGAAESFAFSDSELASIKTGLLASREAVNLVFDRVAELAAAGQGRSIGSGGTRLAGHSAKAACSF